MVILKYDTCRKRHIHTQRYKWRKDIPVFLTGVRAIESDDDWQWVSVLSECDRTDTSAADCLQHIALFYVLLQYMMYRQSYWHVFYNFVSFECNWSFFLLHATVYIVSRSHRLPPLYVRVRIRVCGRLSYLKYGLFLSLLTLLSVEQRLLKCFSALTSYK